MQLNNSTLKMADLPVSYVHRISDGFSGKSPEKEELDVVEVVRKEQPPRRSRSEINAERKAIVELLKEGKSNKEVYFQLRKKGFFVNGNGDVISQKNALPVLGKVRRKENLPNKPNINSKVNQLIKSKVPVAEIKAQLNINNQQIVNAFARLRIKLSAYKRGEIVYLK